MMSWKVFSEWIEPLSNGNDTMAAAGLSSYVLGLQVPLASMNGSG